MVASLNAGSMGLVLLIRARRCVGVCSCASGVRARVERTTELVTLCACVEAVSNGLL